MHAVYMKYEYFQNINKWISRITLCSPDVGQDLNLGVLEEELHSNRSAYRR